MALNNPAKFDLLWPEFLCAAAGIAMAVWGNGITEPLLLPLVTDKPDAVYSAIAGVQGSLLGFVLAALTIVLGYSQTPSLSLLRKSGQLPNLFRIYLAGIRAHALSTVTALVSLIANYQGELSTVGAWVVTTTCTLAFVRLARTLWATRAIVGHIAASGERKPGQA
jgi:hypothetical protein